MPKKDKDMIPQGRLAEEITMEFGTDSLSSEDMMKTEEAFHRAMDDAREGTLAALFMVTIDKDDTSRTFFSGKDGEEQTTGLLAMAAIYQWLIAQGIMMTPEQMVTIGQQMRGEDGSQ